MQTEAKPVRITRRHLACGLALALACIPLGRARAAEPIRIGVLSDLSSFGSDVTGTGSLVAARLAAEDFNGQVAGRAIVLLSADGQNKPDIAAAIVRKWFDTQQVDAVVGVPQTAVALAVQEISRARGKVLLVTNAVTQDLTGKDCAPYTVHWAEDTYALSGATAREVVASGKKSWFFVTADFGFGTTMQAALTTVVDRYGGRVVGSVRSPTGTDDYSSFLLTAQASRADVVALVNVGSDLVTSLKQAHEFGLTAGGQQMVAPLVYLSDIKSLGLETAQGLLVTAGYYWDDNDTARSFADRFEHVQGRKPNQTHAATYAALRSYLAAIQASDSVDAETVIHQMKASPTEYLGKPATIRADGRVLFDLGVYTVKAPGASTAPFDLYRKLGTISGPDVFMPMEAGGCTTIPGR